MFQPIIIYLKSGEVGFCTLEFKNQKELRERVENMSKSSDVDRISLESHLPTLGISAEEWLDFIKKNYVEVCHSVSN